MNGAGLLFIIILLVILIGLLVEPLRRLLNRSKWEVFVSHRRQDRKAIEPIIEQLKHKGIKIWVDWHEITPEFDPLFRGMISEAIQLSSHALLFTSANYSVSTNCMEEADYFLKRFSKEPKRIIEVRLEPNVVRQLLQIPEASIPIDFSEFQRGSHDGEYDYDALALAIADRLIDKSL